MRTNKQSSGGVERYILAVALLVPLAIGLLAVLQLTGADLKPPTTLVYADNVSTPIVTHKPAASEPAPPPTLAAPTPTIRPTAAPTQAPTQASAAQPTATPKTNRSYTVKKGDELKQIAAQYGVDIWKIINANDIPNPDSLTIGQVLHIPDN